VLNQPFEDVLLRTASALSIVDLSRGITGDLTVIAEWVVTFFMLVGRVNPLSFGTALFYEKRFTRNPTSRRKNRLKV
jgi:Trk-type K+ transport system membrane component